MTVQAEVKDDNDALPESHEDSSMIVQAEVISNGKSQSIFQQLDQDM